MKCILKYCDIQVNLFCDRFRMSLAEKVKLFSMKKAEEEKEVVKSVGPRRRPRRMQSRFRTQVSHGSPTSSQFTKTYCYINVFCNVICGIKLSLSQSL